MHNESGEDDDDDNDDELVTERKMRWQWQGLINRLVKFVRKFIPETKWGDGFSIATFLFTNWFLANSQDFPAFTVTSKNIKFSNKGAILLEKFNGEVKNLTPNLSHPRYFWGQLRGCCMEASWPDLRYLGLRILSQQIKNLKSEIWKKIFAQKLQVQIGGNFPETWSSDCRLLISTDQRCTPYQNCSVKVWSGMAR